MPDNAATGNTKPNPPGTQGTPGGAQGGTTGGLGGGRGAGGGATNRRDNAAPGNPAAPVIDGNALIQLTPLQLQQLLANAVTSNAPAPAPKCPKFWEEEPKAWFLVFRGHYEGRNFSQLALFKALLPLLPTLAVSLCRPLVEAPTAAVMDDAQRLLLQHYELSPMERGKALIQCTSLGDRTPKEMLQYMRSLQPGEPEGVMFRYVFVSLLPDVVREVVSSIDSLDEMATTAGNILQANVAATARLCSVSGAGATPVGEPAVAALRRPPPKKKDSVCRLHSTYGRDAFRCDKPTTCPMRNVIRTTPLSGNGPAGRQ